MRLVAEFEHYIIRVTGVAHGISASQQHLEWNVRHCFTQLRQSLPGTLVQETESHVKCCTLNNKEKNIRQQLNCISRFCEFSGWKARYFCEKCISRFCLFALAVSSNFCPVWKSPKLFATSYKLLALVEFHVSVAKFPFSIKRNFTWKSLVLIAMSICELPCDSPQFYSRIVVSFYNRPFISCKIMLWTSTLCVSWNENHISHTLQAVGLCRHSIEETNFSQSMSREMKIERTVTFFWAVLYY